MFPLQGAAAASGGGLRVEIVEVNLSITEDAPGSTSVSWFFNISGAQQSRQGDFGSIITNGIWLLEGSPGDYAVRATKLGGANVLNGGGGGATPEIWISLTSTVEYVLAGGAPPDVTEVYTNNGIFEIRDAVTLQVLASAPYSGRVTLEP